MPTERDALVEEIAKELVRWHTARRWGAAVDPAEISADFIEAQWRAWAGEANAALSVAEAALARRVDATNQPEGE